MPVINLLNGKALMKRLCACTFVTIIICYGHLYAQSQQQYLPSADIVFQPGFSSFPESNRGLSRQIGGSRWVTPTLTIKTNITELATSTLNIGIEQWLSDRWTLSLPISYNPWTFSDNRKIKHLAVQPEFRKWFGETFRGSFINVQSFIGIQTHYLFYNTGGVNIPFGMFPDPKETRYQGDGVGGVLTYGNPFGLGCRWRGEIGTTLVFTYIW